MFISPLPYLSFLFVLLSTLFVLLLILFAIAANCLLTSHLLSLVSVTQVQVLE